MEKADEERGAFATAELRDGFRFLLLQRQRVGIMEVAIRSGSCGFVIEVHYSEEV